MIFISHTSKDKPIVEPIALRLASIYGEDKVFYDSWSIQPGDGIIDRMTQGMSECKFFFFFVSKNSLQSKMVSLEWQNTLLRATNGDVKMIPVKLDDCLMPAILLQSLYIDVFGKGLEVAIRQMVDVIERRNTFRSMTQTYENVRGRIKYSSASECEIEFYAEYYLEPISQYIVLFDNPTSQIHVTCESDGMFITGLQEGIALSNGTVHNCWHGGVSRGTTPGFPFRIKIRTSNGEKLSVKGLLHAKTEEQYMPIPYSWTEENQ